MVKLSYLDLALYSLADPTRRDIILNLTNTSLNVTELHKRVCRIKLSLDEQENSLIKPKLKMSLPALSKHLKVLENARLIKRDKSGREYRFSLTQSAHFWLKKLEDWEKFLDER